MSADLAVQCSKLTEWLLGRRAIPEDFPKLLAAVQARVHEAAKEQVVDKAARALIQEGDNIHYLAAKEIYEAILRSPEGQSKTLLGGHAHAGAAKWKAVVDAYKRRHLGWASSARVLIQNVSYEVPALKKQAAACERQVQDCTARQAELDRQEANAKSRYRDMLNELGIEGFDVRKELWQRSMQELALLSQDVLQLVRQAGQDVASCYQAFADHGRRPDDPDEVLPLMRALQAKDPSVQELELKVPELRSMAERARAQAAAVETGGAETEPAPAEPTAEAEIDWGITCESGDGINWDFEEEKAPPEHVEPESTGIDWGVSFDGFEVAEAAPEEATPFLAEGPARELLTREVAEASAFLAERACHGEEYGPKASSPTQEALQAMGKLETLLSARRTQQLVLLASSESYRERTAKRLEIAKLQCGKPAQRKAELEKVKADQAAEAKRTRAEVDKFKATTLAVKDDLEAELSAHFKSTVRIVGEISQM
ncbi:unnamed protein product [Effrenium voratum]|uniref:Uncharacterized protein n=1 Tax=Effrenium voratum TaxID=2562239 RepID=A0AA36HM06_9DINO|nr:unnamed protein product [Effrenium voratum]